MVTEAILVPALVPRKTALFPHRRHLLDRQVTEAKLPQSPEQCRAAVVPMADVLGRMGSKWTIHVVIALLHGPMRFGDLRRQVTGISQKMLTQTLRELEEDGLVTRTVTPVIPPRVDYELTPMGMELQGPLSAMGEWATRNRERVASARRAYGDRGRSA